MPHKIDPEEVIPKPLLHQQDGDTVGLWQLTGDGTDETGNYDLTETGTVPFSGGGAVGYQIEKCPEITTANYYARPSYDAGLDIKGNLTIMCLVRMNASTSGDQTLVVFQNTGTDSNSANNTQYRFYINTALKLTYFAESGSGTNTSASSTQTLTRSVWHHVAMTRDASGNVRFYLDGVEDGPYATTVPDGGSAAWFQLGSTGNPNQDIDGLMSSVIVKDVQSSASEISDASDLILPTWKIVV